MRIIESLELWNTYRTKLKEKCYYIWQTQYSVDHPEGFHVWFAASGKTDFEVVTHNLEVYNAIMKYKGC